MQTIINKTMSQQSLYNQSPSFSAMPLTSKESVEKISSLQSNKIVIRRRAGIVSRKIQYLYKGDSIESGKTTKRRTNRRYAITKYSKVSYNCNPSCRDNQIYADDDRVYYLEENISNDDKVFVFDENDNLDFNIDSSQFFISLIILYYKDSYTINSSDTHRRIIQATIFSDLKDKGYKFLKKSLLHPGKLFVLDDVHSMMVIKKQLLLQGTSHSF